MKCYMSQPRRRGAGPGSSAANLWNIIITEWALDAYLNLKHAQVFADHEYWTVLRPDVELLRTGIPSAHPKFANTTFWGPAKQGNVALTHGYKMKWRQIGPGRVQLRLPVMAGSRTAFLCEAYVKTSRALDQRKMARFKTHMNLIAQGRYVYRGQL
jgi:hypothetical protein